MLLDLLYEAPSWSLFLGFAGTLALAALAIALTAARIHPAPATKEHLDAALRALAAITGVLTLTLAFSAGEARMQLQEARGTVQREASALHALGRAGFSLPEPARVRGAARDYALAVAGSEFAAMRQGGAAEEAEAALARLEAEVRRAVGMVGGAVGADLLRQLDEIGDLRDARLRQARGGVPDEFWILVMLLTAALLGCGALFPPTPTNLVLLVAQSSAMGFALAFVFVMDQPYRGSVSANAAPLLHVAEVLAR